MTQQQIDAKHLSRFEYWKKYYKKEITWKEFKTFYFCAICFEYQDEICVCYAR
jgi:hypothetical protein